MAAATDDDICARAAKYHAEGKTVEALKCYIEGAKQGRALAQLTLAKAYRNGELGLSTDPEEAANWYTMVAEKWRDPSALFALAEMCAAGEGVKLDEGASFTFCRRAAEQGYAPAMARLGMMYAKGIGAEKDFKEAGKWVLQAAEAGEEEGILGAALLFGTRLCVASSPKEVEAVRRHTDYMLKHAAIGTHMGSSDSLIYHCFLMG